MKPLSWGHLDITPGLQIYLTDGGAGCSTELKHEELVMEAISHYIEKRQQQIAIAQKWLKLRHSGYRTS